MKSLELAFFDVNEDGFFVGNDPARGPWRDDACHAGPVTGLVVRAFENLVPDKMLTRITIELLRPLPMAGLRVEAEITRQGRKMEATMGEVLDGDGNVCARASGMLIAEDDLGEVPSYPEPPLHLSEATRGCFPVMPHPKAKANFASHAEIAYPPGETMDPGPTTLWMKTPPLLLEEETSPAQRICPLADCGSGISRNVDFAEMSFMNCDLTIMIHRKPSSTWLASKAKSYWESSGIGLGHATIMDEEGPVATALQTLLLRPS
ncbi:thioesterase family protein [Pseudovibrio ascidiaceicola]|uniref:thioesterase family protein n=1 Tax=Pseudovibrio ascidiaceicola TaxID=285279 RepID=UPI003D36D727